MGLPPEFPIPDDEDDPDDSPLFPGDSAQVTNESETQYERSVESNRDCAQNYCASGTWKEPTTNPYSQPIAVALCRPHTVARRATRNTISASQEEN